VKRKRSSEGEIRKKGETGKCPLDKVRTSKTIGLGLTGEMVKLSMGDVVNGGRGDRKERRLCDGGGGDQNAEMEGLRKRSVEE